MVFTKKHGGGEDRVGLGGAGGHKGTQPAVRGFGCWSLPTGKSTW